MKVAFIIINYNHFNITLNNIANILSLKGDIARDIFIVDNASVIKDYSRLKEGLPDCKNIFLIRSEKNLGYFGGINLGLKNLDSNKYTYIIVANNDLIYQYDFLEILAEKQYSQNCLVIAPELVTLNGKYQNPQRVNKPGKFRRFCYDLYYTNYVISLMMEKIYSEVLRRKINQSTYKSQQKEIFQLTGACIILTREFFKKCSFLDDSVFMWGEEVLLAHQVEIANGVIIYDPSLYVIHMDGTTIKRMYSRRIFKIRKQSYKIYREYYK